jgi:hypothetical protein
MFLLVFSIRLQGHSLLGEANLCAHGLVTNGAVVYWLHGFKLMLFEAFVINVEISTN